LEAPPGEDPEWIELYTARDEEVPPHRPILTGDVFEGVAVVRPRPPGEEPTARNKQVIVLQHPCTMRGADGRLRDSLLVATLRDFPVLPRSDWNTNEKCMPLPDLRPSRGNSARNQAAFFESLALVHPGALAPDKRIACLSEQGVCLLLQRWMYHSSRLVVPTWKVDEANSHVFAEADLGEGWAEIAVGAGLDLQSAEAEFNDWLSEKVNNATRRDRLRLPPSRSAVQREMKQSLRTRYPDQFPA
jgi:hypothetical protein